MGIKGLNDLGTLTKLHSEKLVAHWVVEWTRLSYHWAVFQFEKEGLLQTQNEFQNIDWTEIFHE